MFNIEIIKTEVFIIGAGGAGLRAALAAREQGAEVTVASKHGGNSTIMAVGAFAAVLEDNPYGDTPETHYQDTLDAGKWINNIKLVELLVNEAPKEIKTFCELGVKFNKDKDGNIKIVSSGGHSYPRTLTMEKGSMGNFYKILYNKVKGSGAKVLTNFFVFDMLYIEEENSWIVLGLNSKDELTVVRCKSVIIATGGLGQLYNNTSNPSGITGEGYMLAHRAGGQLIDMEFVQFMPTCLVYPHKFTGYVVQETLRGEGAKIFNKNLERFMLKYSPDRKEMETRDVLSRCIYKEIQEGRGTLNNGVYLDLKEVPAEILQSRLSIYNQLIKIGFDVSKDLLEICPAAHFSCGGIKIDENCWGGMPGLYAAGEAAGGVHGANRLGGNGLTEMIVFGRIAGESAGNWAKNNKISTNNESAYKGYLRKSKFPLDVIDGGKKPTTEEMEKLKELKGSIQNIMWESAGLERCEESLKKGLQQLKTIREEIDNIKTESRLSLTLKDLVALGEIVLKAALIRRESRGTHYRSDC